MNSIVLSNRFKIITPTEVNTRINDFFSIGEVQNLDRSSTRLKDNSLSIANKLIVKQVKRYSTLEENWDSYGATKVADASISKAIKFIKQINNFDLDVYLASPGPNTEILIQLKAAEKELEFIFYPDKAKVVQFDGGDFISQRVYNVNELSELIYWLHGV